MNFFSLAFKSIRHRFFVSFMTIVSISLSVALVLGVDRISKSGKESFGGAISGVDLIVGPRTGSLSLLLSSVFRIGAPSQTIPYKAVEYFSNHKAVSWVTPFSLGDGFKGFPVIGVSSNFFERYKHSNSQPISFSQGNLGNDKFSAVLGDSVAKETGLKIDDKIVVSHGHSEDGDGFETHEGQPLTVSGILELSGTPIDRGVWVSLEAIAAMHESGHEEQSESGGREAHDDHNKSQTTEDHHHEEHHEHPANEGLHDWPAEQVSGFFLGAKDRSSSLTLMREINSYESVPLTSIMPAVVLNELWRTMAVGENSLRIVAMMVAIVGIFGMWVALHILASTRLREIAVLRAMGASPKYVVGLFTGEAFLLTIAGIVGGVMIMYIGFYSLTPFIAKKYGVMIQVGLPSPGEWTYLGTLLVLGCLTGFFPAIRAYRNALHDGLSVKF